MTASCSRYNEEEKCIIISPIIVRSTWNIVGWNFSALGATNMWLQNIEEAVNLSNTWYAITARLLNNAIIVDNGGEAIITARGYIMDTSIASVSQTTFNQLSSDGYTTLLARDGMTNITYREQEYYSVTNGLYKTNLSAYTVEDSHGWFISQGDNDGVSYFYRGNINNNFVKFGFNEEGRDLYWRIVRINGDGSIRLIYNGTSTNEFGPETSIGNVPFNKVSNDNAYVGYMYGLIGVDSYDATHANLNSSDVKVFVENWYRNNIASSIFENKIEFNGIFCGDRNIPSGSGLGYGIRRTNYIGRLRTARATLRCLNTMTTVGISSTILENHDQFSYKNADRGNKTLEYPVGLITSDEIRLAGVSIWEGGSAPPRNNSDVWLWTGETLRTMTPSFFDPDYNYAATTRMYNEGALASSSVANNMGIRPVVNLKASVIASGDGTINSPYVIIF